MQLRTHVLSALEIRIDREDRVQIGDRVRGARGWCERLRKLEAERDRDRKSWAIPARDRPVARIHTGERLPGTNVPHS